MSFDSLKNNFLIAMPGLADPRFSQSVTYICEHNEGGAMGIVINQSADMSFNELFDHLNLPMANKNDSVLLRGGPVQKERGFVLHSSERSWQATQQLSSDICLTGSKDILQDIAADNGPDNVLIALGYAGWSQGQLEQEIIQNSWLTAPASSDVLFNTPLDNRWTAAAKQLGIDVHLLSSQPGHA